MTSSQQDIASLTDISPFESCVCSRCGTKTNKSPKGMYRYSDSQTSYVVCGICVHYKGVHTNLLQPEPQLFSNMW